MTNRFRPGDRVIHVRNSQIPEGTKGTILGPIPSGTSAYERGYSWEVEYDGYPCDGNPNYPWMKSKTSWCSRDESIELTTEEALKRVRSEP